jgi:HEAT repeat protein
LTGLVQNFGRVVAEDPDVRAIPVTPALPDCACYNMGMHLILKILLSAQAFAAVADTKLQNAVDTIAGRPSFNALIEGGKVQLSSDIRSAAATMLAARYEQLQPLLAHKSIQVRTAAAIAVIESHPQQLDSLAKQFADPGKINHQSFDIWREKTGGQLLAEVLCQYLKEKPAQAFLRKQLTTFNGGPEARRAALECIARKLPKAAYAIATRSLEKEDPDTILGAIGVYTGRWLKANKLSRHALRNNTAKILKLTVTPPAKELHLVLPFADHADSEIRKAVGEAVAWIPDPAADKVVEILTRDKERAVRMLTFRSYINRARLDPVIVERCITDKDPFTSECARFVIRAEDPLRHIEVIRKHLLSPHLSSSLFDLEKETVARMPTAARETFAGMLQNLAEHEIQNKEPERAGNAVEKIGRFGGKDARPRYLPYLSADAPELRQAALVAMVEAGDTGLGDMVAKTMESDKKWAVRNQAAETLYRLGLVKTYRARIEAVAKKAPDNHSLGFRLALGTL